jgi:hypothetical protein
VIRPANNESGPANNKSKPANNESGQSRKVRRLSDDSLEMSRSVSSFRARVAQNIGVDLGRRSVHLIPSIPFSVYRGEGENTCRTSRISPHQKMERSRG